MFLPGIDDGFHRGLPHVLDGAQPEPDRAAFHDEGFVAPVDVGRQHLDAHLPAFVDQYDDFLGIGHLIRQQRGHERHGVVHLQIGLLESEYGIARRMALVEGVPAEILDQAEYFLRDALIDAVLHGPVDEIPPFFGHDFGLLLGHGLP